LPTPFESQNMVEHCFGLFGFQGPGQIGVGQCLFPVVSECTHQRTCFSGASDRYQFLHRYADNDWKVRAVRRGIDNALNILMPSVARENRDQR
jgi:hypothetical protein